MKYTELQGKDEKELRAMLKEQKLLLFNEKLRLKTMQLTNPKLIGAVRKDIARINTALNSKQKGK